MDYGRKSFPWLWTERKSGREIEKNGPNEITCKLMAGKIVVLFYCSPTRHLKPLTDWYVRPKIVYRCDFIFVWPKRKRSRRKAKRKKKYKYYKIKITSTNKHKFADKLQNRVRSKFMSHFHLDWLIVFKCILDNYCNISQNALKQKDMKFGTIDSFYCHMKPLRWIRSKYAHCHNRTSRSCWLDD